MSRKKMLIKLAIMLVIIFLSVGICIKYNLIGKASVESIKNYINSYGHFAAIIFILIFSLRTFLVIFPYSIMVLLGGSLFGHTKGFIYSMIAVFITASIAFFVSRFAGKEFVQKILRGKMNNLDLKVEKHGLRIIFLMRISTIFPYDILNYAAGLSKVKYKDFILGTILGIIPETFSLTLLGSNLDNPFSIEFFGAIILVILTVAVPFFINRRKKT